ncbi:nitrate reductase molybdenum cofactor assembly chaperone [Amylibacter sp. SFDW26]|uniref:nitrate reductase molybdenum cofactor assembly chaperone n=1 Tax=Amylibacter sp. SFDW26 TaxID=2652722 RepID=UPI001261D086|nr:nitrate reductase molybdenum cofactor assembly chaperone [Amylibacter sp. SFDW26]KAB7610175.1 nitrate reductase molybdenum cofactor assembly chaperone [Amylibacter sp. SFDW26]
MDRTLKSLSLILSYPTKALQEAMPEIAATLAADTRMTTVVRRDLRSLVTTIAGNDIYELEEAYVGLFDRSRTLSLNLFEHVHGESRDRGGAMVSLIETYRDAGFDPATSELPDHLPVLLEYLSMRPFIEVVDILTDTAHILEALHMRLGKRKSAYAPVFKALLQISNAEVDAEAVAELIALPDDDPEDLEALDQVWEESEVIFGPDPNGGCPQVRDMLAQMDTPINSNPNAASKEEKHA